MQALVTGGAGFIGSHVADALIRNGHQVRILDDLSSGSQQNVNPSAELILGDVSNAEDVAKAMHGADVVFHQAAHRAVFRSVLHPLDTDRANTHGTLTVLQTAHESGVRRVVCASSSSVYGGSDQLPTPETAPLLPKSPYAVSKLAGEHYCRVFSELYGVETVSLRYFNVYGPRQSPDSAYAAVVPLFIRAVMDRRPPEVHGDGLQSRDFTYIDDVVDANLAAGSVPAERIAGRAFNIAGGHPYSLLDVLAITQELLDTQVQPAHINSRPGDVRHTHADIAAAARHLGHEPQTNLREGLRHTIAWFAADPEV